MLNTINLGDIEYALRNAEIDYADIRDTFNGPSLTGETCLSVVFAGKRVQRDLCRFFLELGAATSTGSPSGPSMDDLASLAACVSTDDRGMDTIVYFPGWALENETPNDSAAPLKDDETAHVNAPTH